MFTLSDSDFIRLTTFIQTNFGINLTQKKQLIVSRLNSLLKSNGYTSFTQYIDDIINNQNPAELETLLNLLTTNYTYFMREHVHFDYFKDVVLPYLEKTKKDKVLSIWSAGCSSGEEPYTLSILLKEHFKKTGWDTRILATDISRRVLDKAYKGTYPAESLKDMPKDYVSKYFNHNASDNTYTVTDDLRSNIIFRTFNLMDEIKFKLKFDVIFCRNVMIYFDKDTKGALAKRFYNATSSGGYLFIGHSESISEFNTGYKTIISAAYRKP